MGATAYFIHEPGCRLRLTSIEPLGFPRIACKLEYLNEGGANLVFKVLPGDEHSELPPALKCHLLRLRKDVAHIQNTSEQHQAFNENFKDLFPVECIIQHQLVQLDEGLPYVINETLKRLNRPSHRGQDFVPQDEQLGLLVTDMTPGEGDVLVQLKPKWLAQSPNAPPNSKRCRTCALRAQRISQRRSTATDAQANCPLELVSEHTQDRERAAVSTTTDGELQRYLIDNALPLLRDLREYQQLFDKKGILAARDADVIFDVCKAMTLRDCTLFLKRSGNHFQARLGDLDLKQPERLAKWKQAEHSLIREGWYTNSEDKGIWRAEQICLLSQ